MKGKKKRERGPEGSAPSRSTGSRETVVQQACRLLAIRGRSYAEVETYLLRQGWSRTTVKRALQSLHRLGYINDLELARTCAERYFLGLGWGPAKVAWELRRRGVPEEMSRRVLAEVQSRVAVEELARMALKRKFGETKNLKDRAAGIRALRFLVSRGFDPTVAEAVLEMGDLEQDRDDLGD